MRARLPRWTLLLLLVTSGISVLVMGDTPRVESLGFTPAQPALTTLFTSLFVHVNLSHLISNMLFLAFFGWYVERVLSPARFLLLYLVGGIAATLTHWAMTLLVQPALFRESLAGASGAVSALVGYFALRFYRVRVRLVWSHISRWGLAVPMWVAVLLWVLWQGLGAVLSAGAEHPVEIGYWAHLGGFAFGLMLALLWGAGAEGEREYLLHNATSRLQEGALEEALRWLQPLLQRPQPDTHALLYASEIWQRLGDRETAIHYLLQGMRAAAHEWSLLSAAADRLSELGALHRLAPAELETLLLRAEQHHEPERAARWLATALQNPTLPQRPALLLRYARLLDQSGQHEQAQQVREQLLRDYPDSLQADLVRLQQRRP
ncbi:MAG: rhomboid family intramembrane serine protease [Armatimonadota bacterium]